MHFTCTLIWNCWCFPGQTEGQWANKHFIMHKSQQATKKTEQVDEDTWNIIFNAVLSVVVLLSPALPHFGLIWRPYLRSLFSFVLLESLSARLAFWEIWKQTYSETHNCLGGKRIFFLFCLFKGRPLNFTNLAWYDLDQCKTRKGKIIWLYYD